MCSSDLTSSGMLAAFRRRERRPPQTSSGPQAPTLPPTLAPSHPPSPKPKQNERCRPSPRWKRCERRAPPKTSSGLRAAFCRCERRPPPSKNSPAPTPWPRDAPPPDDASAFHPFRASLDASATPLPTSSGAPRAQRELTGQRPTPTNRGIMILDFRERGMARFDKTR